MRKQMFFSREVKSFQASGNDTENKERKGLEIQKWGVQPAFSEAS
jgi:hypothetical protein